MNGTRIRQEWQCHAFPACVQRPSHTPCSSLPSSPPTSPPPQVQYPSALGTMTRDLANIRAAAFYLSKTELKFDLVSAVDELNKQIRLEFDFTR